MTGKERIEKLKKLSATARRNVSGDFDWELSKLRAIVESTRELCDAVDALAREPEKQAEKPKARFAIDLTLAEATVLHDEIGDIKKKRIGSKLLELYKRLDNYLGIYWSPPRKNAKAISE